MTILKAPEQMFLKQPLKTLNWTKWCIFYIEYYSSASPRWARFGNDCIKFAFCLNKTHLEGHFHWRNTKKCFGTLQKSRVSSMKMVFQIRFVEAERKLYTLISKSSSSGRGRTVIFNIKNASFGSIQGLQWLLQKHLFCAFKIVKNDSKFMKKFNFLK